MLKIVVRRAVNLAKADTFGGADAYAKISFNGTVLGRTEVVQSLNPEWGTTYEVELPTESDAVLASRLHVEVRKHNTRARRKMVCVRLNVRWAQPRGVSRPVVCVPGAARVSTLLCRIGVRQGHVQRRRPVGLR